MFYKNPIKTSRGVGLIEVLITTVVVALGLVTMASMEGNFLHRSGENKIRAYAITLAEQKLEELKNNINKAEFDSRVSNQDTPAVGTGANATFTRTWTVTAATNPNRKTVKVKVAWGTGSDEKVNISGEFGWADPAKSVNSADAADGNGVGGLAPSPNNNSSQLGGGPAASVESTPIISTFANIKKGLDSQGRTILVDTNGAGSGETLLTCYGDTIVPITGSVYTVNTLNGTSRDEPITVDVSQYGICKFSPSGTNATSAPYACYVCGNCTSSPGQNGCPSTTASLNGIGPGGWYGKIGLKGVDDEGGNKEKVCFNEQIVDPNQEAASAREFVTRRTTSLNGATTVTSEGINEPYTCMNFLVVNESGPNSSCATAASSYAAQSPSVTIPPKRIHRALSGNAPNTRLASNNSYCTSNNPVPAYTISGTITGSNLNKVTISINVPGTCNTVSAGGGGGYTYTCTATTNSSVVIISATTTQHNATIGPPASYTINVSSGTTSYPNYNFVAN